MKKRIKTNGFIIFFSVMLIAIFPESFLRFSAGSMDSFFALAGMALYLSGALLRVSSRGYKSEHSGAGTTLVTGGPYQLVRNPMYLGIFLIGTGVILGCFKYWVLLIFVAVLAARYIQLVVKEEKMLFSVFGKVYTDYCRKTTRLLPRAGDLLKKKIIAYLPLKLKWLKKEANSIMPVLTAILALRAWAWIKTGDNMIFVPQFAGIAAIITFYIFLVVFIIGETGK